MHLFYALAVNLMTGDPDLLTKIMTEQSVHTTHTMKHLETILEDARVTYLLYSLILSSLFLSSSIVTLLLLSVISSLSVS